MKKLLLVVLPLLFVFGATSLAFAEKGAKGLFSAKAGDEIYVCACGEACKCGTLAKKEGNCGCGQKLAAAKGATAALSVRRPVIAAAANRWLKSKNSSRRDT